MTFAPVTGCGSPTARTRATTARPATSRASAAPIERVHGSVHEPRDARVRRRTGTRGSGSTSSSSTQSEVWPRRDEPRSTSTPTSSSTGWSRVVSDHDHDHDHPHDPIARDGEPPAAARVRALEELLVEKGVLTREDVRARIDWLVSRSPADGARLVARAWVDRSSRSACSRTRARPPSSSASTRGRRPQVVALENTENVHHMVVCTLCSCYPKALLGPPPDWYKSLPYRSRAVSDPRGVLAEFGVDARRRRRAPRRRLDRRHPLPRRSAPPAGNGASGRGRARRARHARLDDRRIRTARAGLRYG